MKELIAKVAEGMDITEEEAKQAMDIMLSGEATQAQIASFLALERAKGETPDELTRGRSLCRSGRNRRGLYLYLQRIYNVRVRCGGGRASGSKARKSFDLFEIRRGRCAGIPRREYHDGAEAGGKMCE